MSKSSSPADGGFAKHLRTAKWREMLRFVLFGSLNTLIAYLFYLILLSFMPYAAAYTVSYICGIFISYYLNATFVFKEPLRFERALKYPVVYVVQYVLGMASLYLLVELVGISKVVAPFIVAVGMIPVAYLLSRYIITHR